MWSWKASRASAARSAASLAATCGKVGSLRSIRSRLRTARRSNDDQNRRAAAGNSEEERRTGGGAPGELCGGRGVGAESGVESWDREDGVLRTDLKGIAGARSAGCCAGGR